MYDILDVIRNIQDLYENNSNIAILKDFERVIDELDLYAFDNLKKGELVEGPVYEKYFVTCTFMWPYKFMPDPRAAERLVEYDCEVYYKHDTLLYPIKVKQPDDFKAGTKMPKMGRLPIWLVTITVPKKLMQDITQGSLELEGETIDAEDIDQSYEEGLDDKMTQSAPAGAPTAPNAAPAKPPPPALPPKNPIAAPPAAPATVVAAIACLLVIPCPTNAPLSFR